LTDIGQIVGKMRGTAAEAMKAWQLFASVAVPTPHIKLLFPTK
jgi:hypothetical protein